MSFPKAHHTRFAKSPLAYRQYAPDDPVQSSIYDYNMECDASLRYQNRAILFVDSRDRKIREEPSKYMLLLKKEYRDVISIELQRADIPNSNYIINEFNNNFYFQDSIEQEENGTFHTIRLPIGNYPMDDCVKDSVRSLLEQGLNAVNLDNKYEVVVDPNQNKVTITQLSGSAVFNIFFQFSKCCDDEPQGKNNPLPNHMGEILGFKCHENKINATTYMGENTFDLYPSRYIAVRVQGWERIDSNRDSAQNAFVWLDWID